MALPFQKDQLSGPNDGYQPNPSAGTDRRIGLPVGAQPGRLLGGIQRTVPPGETGTPGNPAQPGSGSNPFPGPFTPPPTTPGPRTSIDLNRLYTRSQPAAQVRPDTGQATTPRPIQTTNARAGQATAETAGPASVAKTKTGQATTTQAGATGFDPHTDTVAPTSTVAGQLSELTRRSSPLLERARQGGILSAARRGLQNTSIAAGAAEGAFLDRALPIAQQDAATHFQQQQTNQAAQNRAAEVNTGRVTDISALNAQLGSQTSQFNAQQRNSIATLNAQLEQNANQFSAAEQNRIAALNAQMTTEINARNAAAANEGAFLDAQLRTQITDANAARALALAQGNQQEANRQAQFILGLNSDLNKQFLAGAQANDLANIQGRYNQLISTNEGAARLYDAYFSSISSAMANHELTPDRIASLVNVQQRMLESGLAMMDQMNNIDLTNFALPGVRSVGNRLTTTPGSTPGTTPTPRPTTTPTPRPTTTTTTPGNPAIGSPEWLERIRNIGAGGIPGLTGGIGGFPGLPGTALPGVTPTPTPRPTTTPTPTPRPTTTPTPRPTTTPIPGNQAIGTPGNPAIGTPEWIASVRSNLGNLRLIP